MAKYVSVNSQRSSTQLFNNGGTHKFKAGEIVKADTTASTPTVVQATLVGDTIIGVVAYDQENASDKVEVFTGITGCIEKGWATSQVTANSDLQYGTYNTSSPADTFSGFQNHSGSNKRVGVALEDSSRGRTFSLIRYTN